jgi:Baseplate J-like protein
MGFMSDEQMIYIDPEDDLTNVRTRLEGVESRHITLVIPAQTQLRSHVAWKLLHARARELGKDILIISTDPQIRSVAQAVKFRVANSLEAAQESKPRPSTRPGRSSSPTKGRATSTRNPRSRQFPSSESWPAQNSNPSQAFGAQASESADRATPRLSSSFSADERTYGNAYDYRLDSPVLQPLTNASIEEPDLLLEDFHRAEGIREAASQPGLEEAPARADISAYKITPRPPSDDPFDFMEEKETGAGKLEQHGRAGLHNYDTQQHTIQDVSDLPSGIRDDDDDNNIEFEGDLGDFVVHGDTTPKTIHHSWTEPTPDDEQDFVGPARTYGVRPRGSRSGQIPPLPRSQQIESEDALPPIENRATRQPLRPSKPLPGPRSVPLSPRPSKSLSPRPSKPLSRSDGLSARPSQPLASSRADPLSPRVSKALNNNARSGYQPPSRTSQPLSRSDALRAAPLENRTEMQAPLRSERPRSSKPLSPQEVARVAAPVTRSKIAAPEKPRPQRPAAPKQKQSIFSGSTLLVTVIVLAFLLLAVLAYFLPSADVRVGLPGRTYTHQVQLTLAANHSSSPNVVIGTNYTHDLDHKGSGTATGTTIVGTIPAHGYVIFTNNSSTISARILTGTVLMTSSGIQFVTTSDAVAAPKGGNLQNLVQVPVQAVKPGEAGNVPSGSINTIPDSSLTTIAQSSGTTQTSDIQLTVANPLDITGGGAGNAPQVKQQDLDAAQAALSKQLQSNFMTWLKTQIGANDVIGLPSKTERLVNPPKANQVLPSGTNTFPLELQGTYSVLVLPNADLQLAARAQLNAALKKEKSFDGYTMANGTAITTDHLIIKVNGTEQILTFNATGQAVPIITSDAVKSLIIGKSLSEAQKSLQDSVQSVAPKGTVKVDITTYPISLPLVPYRNDNIQVHFYAVQTPNAPPAKSK